MTPPSTRTIRRLIILLILLAVIAAIVLTTLSYVRRHPQAVPWTPLDLTQPIGPFTGRKLAALHEDSAQCRRLLEDASVTYRALPPRQENPNCSYSDAVRLAPGGARTIALQPAGAGMSCPMAAALTVWERQVVQPAAQRHFGAAVSALDHLGTYSCRRVGGRPEADWSEHATANAFDVAAFRLSDGRRISIVGDWNGNPLEAAFLREVRDGACRLFATVLSPDYNEAHRDHLHLDQAWRGSGGWRACS